jgi:hypothetical protein
LAEEYTLVQFPVSLKNEELERSVMMAAAIMCSAWLSTLNSADVSGQLIAYESCYKQIISTLQKATPSAFGEKLE